MDLRSMPPCLRLLLPIAILALTACDRGSESTATAATPQTWAEYVEKETARREANRERNDGVNMYYRDGVPDISGWTLEDMLPPEAINEKHSDLCELPRDEIDQYFNEIPEDEPARLNYLLEHANRGLVQAQVGVGQYCYAVLSDNPSPISVEDALSWMEKAAASEKGYAMAELGACLTTIRMKTNGRRDSFETDKELYWLLRAGNHLQVKALSHLTLQIGKENIGYGNAVRNFKQNFLWRRLIEFSYYFQAGQEDEWGRNLEGGADKLQDLYNSFSTPDQDSWVTDEAVEEAEAMVAQWLRDHPRAFEKFDTLAGCRLEKEDWGNYEEVNKALAQYQLHIVPPGILREGVSPDLE